MYNPLKYITHIMMYVNTALSFKVSLSEANDVYYRFD